jgi:hypothetical protein
VSLEGDVTRYKSVDNALRAYTPFGLTEDLTAVLTCLAAHGDETGIALVLSLQSSHNPEKVKKESKVYTVNVYDATIPELSGTAQLYIPPDDGEFLPPVLRPVKTFESEFAAFGENPEDENDLFTVSPNGEFYHFNAYTSYGDSQWDALLAYEEHFTASSSLPPTSNGIKYEADNLSNEIRIDDNLVGGARNTTWCEGVKGYGVGEWVTMSIRTKSSLMDWNENICFTELMIVNGYAKDAVTWKNNTRVKTLRLFAGDTHWCDLHLDDVIKPQVFDLEQAGWIFPSNSGKQIPLKGAFSTSRADEYPEIPVYQTDLKFEIVEVYPGDKYDDTCITGIAVNVYGGIY